MNQELRNYLAEIACHDVDKEKTCSSVQYFSEKARVRLARELLEKFSNGGTGV